MDKQKTETLEQRIGREAVEWRERWEVCRGNVEDSDIAAVRPLVERIDGLESDLTATRNAGARYADALTISQDENKALRAEVERLRGLPADANETIKGADESRKGYAAEIERLKSELEGRKIYLAAERADAEGARVQFVADLTRERETVRKLLADNAALETTVDVLAGRLAARGQS